MAVSPKGTTQSNTDGFVPVIPSTGTPQQTPKTAPIPAKMDPIPVTVGDIQKSLANKPETPTHQQATLDNVNNSIKSLLEDNSYYDPNPLNNLRQPTYKFKLYMTTEHDLLGAQKTTTIDDMLKILDSLPKVTIAESGVTAGFNIKDVEMTQPAGPNWASKFLMLSKSSINLTITEPLGTSLIESIFTSGNALGIRNFAKMWYYLELSFIAYNEDGSINTSPLANNKDFTLINNGRWVDQITIKNMDITIDENGSTYKLECIPFTNLAFATGEAGDTPDLLSVSGNTIGEFCTELAKALNKAWSDRYLGEIYKFDFVIHDIPNLNNPSTYSLVSSEPDHDPHQLSLESGSKPTANIAKSTSIHDIIVALYSNCKEAQKMMLDTNNGLLEDDDGNTQKLTLNADQGSGTGTITFNKKHYRTPIVPHIEPAIVITGYDPITGKYMKNITYHIWGYKTYGVNISPSQWDNATNNRDLSVATDIVKELQENGFLRKQYQYRFTGLNTEVIRCDLSYKFAFTAEMPSLSGWRNTNESVSVHAKYNPNASKDGGSQTDQATNPNEIARDKNPKTLSTATATTTTASNNQIKTSLDALNTDIAKYTDLLASTTPGNNPITGKPYTKAELTQLLNNAKERKNGLASTVENRRNASLLADQRKRETLEKLGPTNIYAEDALNDNFAFDMTYSQTIDNDTDNLTGADFPGQWDRGRSLVGALLSQMTGNMSNNLNKIELEIRGDPYWLGFSQLDRTAVMTKGFTPTPLTSHTAPDLSQGAIHIAFVFRIPSGIDTNGAPKIRSDDVFTGVYEVVMIKNTFEGGLFKQILSCNRIDMVNLLKGSPPVGSNATPAGTTTTAPTTTENNG